MYLNKTVNKFIKISTTKPWREIVYPSGQNYFSSQPLVQILLTFGIRSTHISFPCSTKCSKSKNNKGPQTLMDYGTKKVRF